jgi:hypothetical protein
LFNVELSHESPVASYSMFPVTLTCAGDTFRTALSMTTMTHPDWRGKGFFPTLAEGLYREAAGLGVSLVWGFPNATSHPVFASKLAWRDIYEIPTMSLDLTASRLADSTRDANVVMDDAFALTYDAPPADDLIRVERSRRYLEWRYARNPVNVYHNYAIARGDRTISSYIVTKKYEDAVDLVDIQCAGADEANALLRHIVAVCRGDAVRRLVCWAQPHHWTHPVLERLGFQNGAPVTYFGARAIGAQAPRDWPDYRAWYLQMGDSDVY